MSVHPAGAIPTSASAATSVAFDANNILALTGTNQITFQNGAGFTYTFDAAGRLLLSSTGSASNPAFNLAGGDIGLYSPGAHRLGFSSNGVGRWEMDASGNFIATADNSIDIGATGATRPRDVYIGSNFVAQTNLKGLLLFNGHFIRASSTDLEVLAGSTVADTMVSLKGRLAAGTTTATSADVKLGTAITRTGGYIVQMLNNGTRKWAMKFDGRVFQGALASAPTDADLQASEVSFYLDEAGNNLKVRVKYADGTTLKTGTLAVA